MCDKVCMYVRVCAHMCVGASCIDLASQHSGNIMHTYHARHDAILATGPLTQVPAISIPLLGDLLTGLNLKRANRLLSIPWLDSY